MRRLVVRNILPGDAKTVLRIVHKCVQAVVCRNHSGVNTEFVSACSLYKLFSPVAEKIGAEIGISSSVATFTACCAEDGATFVFVDPAATH